MLVDISNDFICLEFLHREFLKWIVWGNKIPQASMIKGELDMFEFSIVICAYNAKSRIRETLEHLNLIDYSPELTEIILIDNNSSDGTSEFSNDVWSKLSSRFSLYIVSESDQGLCYARKRGVAESKGRFIVFCDDDNWLDSQYLKNAHAVLENNPAIGVLGGQGIPVTDAEQFPNWFYSYANGYASGVQAMQSGDITSRGYVWGSGFIVRRDVLVNIFASGQSFVLSGRSGNSLASGDDSELCKWFALADYRLWYDESLVFYHFIPESRLTKEYLKKQREGFNVSQEVLKIYDLALNCKKMRRQWMENFLIWLISEIKLLLNRSPEKVKIVKTIKAIERFSKKMNKK